jgi:uncharacterized membrane protein YccF (DUF307 family)
MVRAILNVIWLLFCGVWMAICYVLAGLVCFVLIITIPFGIAAFRIAGYVLWPFGRTIEQNPHAGLASIIGNVLWIILFGWWLAIGHLVAGVALCVTIIGIPLGLASFRLNDPACDPTSGVIAAGHASRMIPDGSSQRVFCLTL